MRSFKPHQQQKGSTLFIALTFLVVITLMGLSGMQTATLQERMAGGERDYSIALQAAEMALRDAEHDLLGLDYTGTAKVPDDITIPCTPGSTGRVCFEKTKGALYSRPLAQNGPNNTPWKSGCPWGQCYISTMDGAASPASLGLMIPLWKNTDLWSNDAKTSSDTTPSSVVYGTFTNATALTSVSKPPRYIIETLNFVAPGSIPVGNVVNFRITARATGLNDNTIVVLQEVFQCSIGDC